MHQYHHDNGHRSGEAYDSHPRQQHVSLVRVGVAIHSVICHKDSLGRGDKATVEHGEESIGDQRVCNRSRQFRQNTTDEKKESSKEGLI